MDRDEQKTPTAEGSPDPIERLRLLVTLQNQIVEQARRNRQAQQDCAHLSQSIVRETARREVSRRWSQTWLLRQLGRVGLWARWCWPVRRAPRKDGAEAVLKTGGFASVPQRELAMAKSARNR